MIERRRRERINDCLNQLKKLVLDATQKDVRHTHIKTLTYLILTNLLTYTYTYNQTLPRNE